MPLREVYLAGIDVPYGLMTPQDPGVRDEWTTVMCWPSATEVQLLPVDSAALGILRINWTAVHDVSLYHYDDADPPNLLGAGGAVFEFLYKQQCEDPNATLAGVCSAVGGLWVRVRYAELEIVDNEWVEA